MEELAQFQKQTGDAIQQLVSNYKKDSPSRKTLPYLKERLRKLDDLWDQFESRDNLIQTNHANETSHPYFTKKYYLGIQEVYDKCRNEMLALTKSLTPESVPPVGEPTSSAITTGQTGQRDDNMDKSAVLPTKYQGSTDQDFIIGSVEKREEHKMLLLNNSAENVQDRLTRVIRRLKAGLQSLYRLFEGIEASDHQLQSKQYYQCKIDTIDRYWSQVQGHHNEAWELQDDPSEAGYDTEEYFRCEDKVQTILIRLSEKLAQCSTPSTNEAAGSSVTMKLPKLVVPTFDGDYLKWRQFYDLFTQMVHNQPMSNCQKMWYLKTNLKGEAEKLIRHFSLSNENYSAAWDTLKARYENTRLLVTALLNKLLSQPKLISESAPAIKALHDSTRESLMGLENLGVPTTNWDPLLLHILVRKLDKTTHGLYEQSLEQPRALQSVDKFLAFLETRFQSLEALGQKDKLLEERRKPNQFPSKVNSFVSTNTVPTKCSLCKENHHLFACQKFLHLTPIDRLKLLKKNNLCINCLRSGHYAANCTLRGCKHCSKKHNTLVHQQGTPEVKATSSQSMTSQLQPGNTAKSTSQSMTLAAQKVNQHEGYVLLSTVAVNLTTHEGKNIVCRAILDSGSQVNLISERIVKKLGLNGTPVLMHVQGIGQAKQQANRRVSVSIQSRVSEFSTRLEAFILKQILTPQPSRKIDSSTWAIPTNIKLADPNFNRPDHVDLLIGAELYFQLISIGQIKLGDGLPTLQNTVFGWVLAGRIDHMPQDQALCCIFNQDQEMDQQLERFWTLEEATEDRKALTPAEKRCEEHFNQTVRRSETGRFIVKLPFLENPRQLGESKDIASRRFWSIERKLSRNSELRSQYVDFMDEYRKLGHMQEIDIDTVTTPCYFVPHHCVVKPGSTTTKLRVVFDASCKTSSNVSLNDILAAGPTIQDELFSILLRFRLPRFVFTADIEKMYRQIMVDKDERKFQLIFWRSSPDHPLKCYQLNTVTYGTTSAPYLATKCLQRLAQEGAEAYPLGAEVLERDFYVDDVISGSNSLFTACDMQTQLIALLSGAGFTLRKWCANHPRLLKNIPQADIETQLTFGSETEEQIKILGLTWLPTSDSFCIKTTKVERNTITKRTACSDIARLFDPLGIMSPVVVTAKLFLQQLWALKIDWDASLPMELHTQWAKFREDLQSLNDIKFPRHVFSQESSKSTQIHTFADASQKAYGAALYIRSINKDKQVVVRLLCAKSKVAPIKQVTLPRLELCAAKLAAELTSRVKKDLNLKNEPIYYWTDSEVVLAWLNSSSSSFHTFVANRVAAIQELSSPEHWRHVGSRDNPADLLTRGLNPEKLKSCNLWFYGPLFLYGSESTWPQLFPKNIECDLEKKRVALPVTERDDSTHFIRTIDHRNSFKRLKRVTAYVLRFINRLRHRTQEAGRSQPQSLKAQELNNALVVIVKVMQEEYFSDEIKQLRQYKDISRNSPLTGMAPFLDENEIIRVGGRLQAADVPYEAKHPILLPYSHQFTKLLMTEIHLENLHAGPQTLLAITRQHFWPIKGKTIARSVVQHCIRCTRAKPNMMSQIMGNLPPHRVQPARPFVNAGVDFCGPLWTHFKVRGKRPQKSYIAVFCCFATKAVHLEVVSDLTTQAFLGALKRFTARRGHCKNIYCDNATNFIGAKNELEELKETIYSERARTKIAATCGDKGTDFHFIPPRAPHFGGLWEAAVKSAKHLLKRTVGNASLTYEELETVVVEIEAILNSRPITPLSSDPNDLSALTPGHFLIGEPLTSTIDSNTELVKASLLTRWKLVAHLKNEFWKRWSREYLNELQQRHKWKNSSQNIEPGTLVIIKEDNVPTLKWPLGRVISVIKGNDGFARVADVRVTNNIIRRPIHRLAPLPIVNEEIQMANDPQARKPDRSNQTDSTIVSSVSTQRARPSTSTTRETPKKKARTSLRSAITTLLIVCLCLPASIGSPIKITPFKSQPGLHFENLGTANVITNEWNLIVYYDMRPYWREFEGLLNGSRMLHDLCDSITKEKSCSTIITQLEHLKDDLASSNELLIPQSSTARTRRGAVNFIGNIANALFGVLDADYAEEMSQTIEDIKSNENHLLNLIKNQTTIVDSTVNVIRKSEEQWRRQIEEIKSELTQLVNFTQFTSTEIQQERLTLLFTSLSIQTMLVASNIQRAQFAIIDTLTDTHHGRVSPQLISPSQLKQELFKIRNHLAASLRLPVRPDDVLKLYNLMKSAARVTSRHIIFKLSLPLLGPEEFELFRIIPIPVLVNGTFVRIVPSSNFLIINLHRDQYYPLTEPELQSCISVEEDHHLCKQTHPIYKKGSSKSSCEVNLINEVSSTSSCQFTNIGDEPQWIQLNNPNQWIFVMKEKTLVKVVCGTDVTATTMEGSGILQIQENCVIKQNELTIQGHNIYPSIKRMSYTPTSNIINSVKPEQLEAVIHKVPQYKHHLDELEAIKARLNLQLANSQLPRRLQAHDIHQFAVGYIAMSLAAVVIACFAWKFRGDICNWCRNLLKTGPHPRRPATTPRPTPHPRRSTARDFDIAIDNQDS